MMKQILTSVYFSLHTFLSFLSTFSVDHLSLRVSILPSRSSNHLGGLGPSFPTPVEMVKQYFLSTPAPASDSIPLSWLPLRLRGYSKASLLSRHWSDVRGLSHHSHRRVPKTKTHRKTFLPKTNIYPIGVSSDLPSPLRLVH